MVMKDQTERTYLAIDLKSFYASAECASRGLNALSTNLVVADVSRTDKTICLAVSPSLKAYGIPGRARLFEVKERLEQVNEERRLHAPRRQFVGESCDADELARCPQLKVGFLAAKPRMSYYLNVSASIYSIYLRYASAEDIHVYSIDEVFIDVTRYRKLYHATPHELARRIVQDIIDETGITATAGIGSNMYLAKVAMDIVAKHMPADRDGVRVAELNETSYKQLLWAHRPLTDFWRVGRGYARKLERYGLLTMGDIARCSLGRASDYYNEDLLYRMFGINAELLIDHAWGREPCTIADVKAYRPAGHSLSNGQVLHRPYPYESARLVVREMADSISLELVDKGLVARQIGLYVGYEGKEGFEGSMPVSTNRFGKKVPRPANGSLDLGEYTSSTKVITAAMMTLYDRIVDQRLMVRRLNIVVSGLRSYDDSMSNNSNASVDDAAFAGGSCDGDRSGVSRGGMDNMRCDVSGSQAVQLDLFADEEAENTSCRDQQADQQREHDVQQTLLAVKRKFGKNAVLKAMNLESDATGRDRNNQIGGHAAGDSSTNGSSHGNTGESGTKAAKVDAMNNTDGVDTAGNVGSVRAAGTNAATRTMSVRSLSDQAMPSQILSAWTNISQTVPGLRTTHQYDDIIGVKPCQSITHPRMSQHNRAAQFMPFAALAGYDQILLDTLHRLEDQYRSADIAGDHDWGA